MGVSGGKEKPQPKGSGTGSPSPPAEQAEQEKTAADVPAGADGAAPAGADAAAADDGVNGGALPPVEGRARGASRHPNAATPPPPGAGTGRSTGTTPTPPGAGTGRSAGSGEAQSREDVMAGIKRRQREAAQKQKEITERVSGGKAAHGTPDTPALESPPQGAPRQGSMKSDPQKSPPQGAPRTASGQGSAGGRGGGGSGRGKRKGKR